MLSKACIFCLEDASQSKSIEHIIPESFGNTDHVLPPGIVCDRCNNYFARKIEEPLLSSEDFRWLRSFQWVPNKRGRVPSVPGIMPLLRSKVDVWLDGPHMKVSAQREADQPKLEELLRTSSHGSIYLPHPKPLDDWLMSRFLGKVAIEAVAHRLMKVPGWREEMLMQDAMVPLRQHVRSGDKRSNWLFARRRLYEGSNVRWGGGTI